MWRSIGAEVVADEKNEDVAEEEVLLNKKKRGEMQEIEMVEEIEKMKEVTKMKQVEKVEEMKEVEEVEVIRLLRCSKVWRRYCSFDGSC